MGDNSNFDLFWRMDTAIATLDTGTSVSEEFNEKGFKWRAGIERRTDSTNDKIDFYLQCDAIHNRPFTCEVEVDISLFRAVDGTVVLCDKVHFIFNLITRRYQHMSNLNWSTMYEVKHILELNIRIVKIEKPSCIFDAPNPMSNAILNIEDKKLHVSKEYLAVHSPVLQILFFGDFAEKGKEEIEIKDVGYEEFLDLLYVIYPGAARFTDNNVLHIIELADRFQMKGVMDQAESYIMASPGIENKLVIARQYRLTKLRYHCLHSSASP